MSMQSIRDTFFEECEDLLEALSEGLSRMESGEADGECLNAVFRAVHSIKGGAGAFALGDLVAFAHRFETVLDEIRYDRLTLSDEVMHVLLRSADHLADQVEAAHEERSIDEDITAGFLANLAACLGDTPQDLPPADEDFGFAAITLDFSLPADLTGPELSHSDADPPAQTPSAQAPSAQTPPDHAPPGFATEEPGGEDRAPGIALLCQRHPEPGEQWLHFRPWPRFYSNGHDPLTLLDGLLTGLTGPLSAAAMDSPTAAPMRESLPEILPILTEIPSLDSYDPATPWLAWKIALAPALSPADLEGHFEFVRGLCDLTPGGPPDTKLPHPKAAPDAPIAAATGTTPPLPEPDLPEAGPSPLLTMAAPPAASGPEASDAPSLRRRAAKSDEDAEGRSPKPTLRVDLERVDRLINAVGELIINQAMIEQSVADLSLPAETEIITHTEDYRLLARDLQEAVMAIRAQPVKPLFQRMSRIVREAAEATGKPARLVTAGESSEVDKTVVERLADPLTHMIRNAVDHGLESAETRALSGKDPEGTIRLSAAHRSGSVIITISDDGGGLDRSRILAKAVSRGLVPEGADLADAEIDNLLFLPGFSTAEKISNLSGRGVGLDVVKNAVAALGGRIAISSTLGIGTEFTISLPLTLAVMDGMVISVAGQTMVIPISSVIETVRPAPSDLHLLGTSDRLLAIRGRFLPMIDVAQCLGFGRRDPGQAPLALLVETDAQAHCALIVDAVLDQRQVVIKGLDSNYGAVPGVSAATVLGDGQIALILDTEALTSNLPGHFPGRIQAQGLAATVTGQTVSALPPHSLPQSHPGASHAVH